MIASARASTASRRSSRTVFDGLPATSVILSFTRGVPEACWSAQSWSASRCGPPLGVRAPERSSSAVTLSALGSRVGVGAGVAEGFAAVHALRRRTIASVRATRPAALGARPIRKRIVRGIHVPRRVLRARIRLALGLLDRFFDLVGEPCADRLELLLRDARR